MRIIDYVNFDAIISLMSENPLVPNLFFAITDLDGRTVVSTRWQRVCSEFHRKCPGTQSLCVKSDLVLASRIKEGHAYALYSCFNNLTDAAVPIRVEDEIIGNLIIGQVFIKQPDLDFFLHQAHTFGFNENEYLSAINAVPVVEEDALRKLLDYYSKIASTFGMVAKEAYRYKQITDKLSRRTAELEYVNGELEAFSYSVSHDLRAPLRHITGYIDLFKRRCKEELSPQGAHYFDAIYDSAQQMGVLIDDLLQFSRNGRAQLVFEHVDMNRTVREIISKFTESHPNRNINWHVFELPATFGDQSMLKFVWQNLIDNSFKFTRNNEQASIEIGWLPEEDAYYIKDNGAGFDMKYANKLFGVFQRLHTSDEFEGTGIGLASAKRVVSRHGGRIWAKAVPNCGAAFYFSLPGKDEQNG